MLAGVTRKGGKCATDEGPIVKVHLQKHPSENRCINVITFENHLSIEYRKESRDGINAMLFQKLSNSSYLRVATSPLPPGCPTPVITFGNDSSSLRFHEADPNISKLEHDLLDMTTYIHRLLDKALCDAIFSFIECLSESKVAKTGLSPEDDHDDYEDDDEDDEDDGSRILKEPSLLQSDHNEITYTFPIGEFSSFDAPDSTVTQASMNKPYSPHSDSGPIKHCNHDEARPPYTSAMMRILSHGFAFPKNNVDISTCDHGNAVVSIGHGIPSCDGDKKRLCQYIGCYCNAGFVKASRNSKILIGGENHAHMQLWGSQGSIHHYLIAVRDDVIRIVVSPRLLQEFQKTPNMQSLFLKESAKIFRASDHIHDCIVDFLSGRKRFHPPPPNSNSTDDDTVRRPRKQSRSTPTKAVIIASAVYPNGDIMEEEQSKRKSIVGIAPAITNEHIIRSVHAVKQIVKTRSSVVLKRPSKKSRKETDSVIIGPFPIECPISGTHLLQPGTSFPDLNTNFNIVSNKHNHQVMNHGTMDVINLHRLTKNSSGLGENLVAVLNSKKTDCHGLLVPFEVRGTGGFGGVVGSNPIDSSNANARREAPTHLPPAGQDPTSKHADALFGLVRCQQCVNVFYQDVYIGLFYAKEAAIKQQSLEAALNELGILKKTLSALHTLSPDFVASEEVTPPMMGELMGMMAVTNSVTLVPVEPNFSQRWKTPSDIVPWSIAELDPVDLVRPVVLIEKESVDRETLLGIDTTYTHWSMVIEKHPSPCSFLSGTGKVKVRLTEMDNPDPTDLCTDAVVAHVNNGTLCMSQIRSAAVHAAGITAAIAVGEVVGENETIIPPRFVLEGIMDKQKLSYTEAMENTNIKSLITRPTHPPLLHYDPSILMAENATDCSPSHQVLDHESMWKERNGPNFVMNRTTASEAFTIIFKCVLCCFLNPSALLQLSRHMQKTNRLPHLNIEHVALHVPAPTMDEFKQLTEFILSLKWEPRFLHRIFRKGHLFDDAQGFISFISMIKERGMGIFQAAAKISQSEHTRQDISDHLIKHLSSDRNDAKLSPFQVQVLMRTIEACIHDPFGAVDVVQSGPGGKQGALCLIIDFDKAVASGVIISSAISKLDKCKEIPNWIVQCYNTWANKALNHADPEVNNQCKDEMLVLRLKWSNELSCLVHVDGIGKKFDASDAEHMLCMVYCMHQYTLPTRNTSTTQIPSRIDSDKYLPVRNSGGLLAKDMSFMHCIHDAFAETMAAYNRLLMDESYPHRKLDDIFRIDLR